MSGEKRWNHAVCIAFQVISDHEDVPTPEEVLPAMLRRYQSWLLPENRQDCIESIESFDVFEEGT